MLWFQFYERNRLIEFCFNFALDRLLIMNNGDCLTSFQSFFLFVFFLAMLDVLLKALFKESSVAVFAFEEGLLFIDFINLFIVCCYLLLIPCFRLVYVVSSFYILYNFIQFQLFLLVLASALRNMNFETSWAKLFSTKQTHEWSRFFCFFYLRMWQLSVYLHNILKKVISKKRFILIDWFF